MHLIVLVESAPKRAEHKEEEERELVAGLLFINYTVFFVCPLGGVGTSRLESHENLTRNRPKFSSISEFSTLILSFAKRVYVPHNLKVNFF